MPDFTPPKQPKPFIKVDTDAPKDPPKEVLERSFEMDSNLLKGDSQNNILQLPEQTKSEPAKELAKEVVPPKQETPPAKEEPKPAGEVKKIETTEPKTGAVKQISLPAKGEKKERDLTGYSAEEAALLKQMSNEAFDYTVKVLKEKKELEKNKDGNWLTHPDAHTLTDEYRTTQSQVWMAGVEAEAWKQALISCEAGKPFKVPTAFDNNGKLVMSSDVEPTAEMKVLLQTNMQQALTVGNELRGKLNNMGQTFKARLDTDNKAIQAERVKRFGWAGNPEMLKESLTFPSGETVTLAQIKEDFKNLWPPYHRNHPVMEVASDIFIALRVLQGELEKAQAGQSVAETKVEQVKRAEPGSDARKGKESETINGVKEFSLAGMPR